MNTKTLATGCFVAFCFFGWVALRGDQGTLIDAISIDAEGNVGIRNPVPQTRLDVSESLRVTNGSSLHHKHYGSDAEVGLVKLYGSENRLNGSMGSAGNNLELGSISLKNSRGESRVDLYTRYNAEESVGRLILRDLQGHYNVYMGHSDAGTDRGEASVYNEINVARVGMKIKDDDHGNIWSDNHHSLSAHPTRPNTIIDYPALHGARPEVYVRGEARLVDGRATVKLPDHFQHVAEPEFVVFVTPLAANSTGLAVTGKSPTGFEVRELNGGRDSYDFHWEAKALKQGGSRHSPVRPDDRRRTAPEEFK